jgi:hypothetical protein
LAEHPELAVVGTDDRVIPASTQHRVADRAGSTITDVAGSHVSMASHPSATIDVIVAATAAVGSPIGERPIRDTESR